MAAKKISMSSWAFIYPDPVLEYICQEFGTKWVALIFVSLYGLGAASTSRGEKRRELRHLVHEHSMEKQSATKTQCPNSALTVPLQCPYNGLTAPIGKTHNALYC